MVSLVMPLYNEEQLVPLLHAAVVDALDRLDEPWEVVYVNDGSRDRTLELLLERQREDPRVTVVELSRNWGHNAAITAGLQVARGDAIAMMDGDLQDPPELIPQMIAKWREGWDVVYAVKASRRENAAKRAAFRTFHWILSRVADIHVPEGAGNLSLMSERVVKVLRALPERARYLSGLRAWVGFKQIGVEFARDERYDSRPRMSLTRLVKLAFDAIFGFSRLPLRISIWVGAFVSLAALAVGTWVLYERMFTENAISGWASTIVSINFIGGAILLTLGVIGEYVGRIYEEVKRRPLYVLQEVVGFETPPPAGPTTS